MKANKLIKWICVFLLYNFGRTYCDDVGVDLSEKVENFEELGKIKLDKGVEDVVEEDNDKFSKQRLDLDRFVISVDSPLRAAETNDLDDDGHPLSRGSTVKSTHLKSTVDTSEEKRVPLPKKEAEKDSDSSEGFSEENKDPLSREVRELLKKNVDDLTQEEIYKIEEVDLINSESFISYLKQIDITVIIEQLFPKEKILTPEEEKIKKEFKIAFDERKIDELKRKFLKLNQFYTFKLRNPDSNIKFFQLPKEKEPILVSGFLTPGRSVGDHIIGIVIAKNSDFYTIQINNIYNGYLMCVDGFRGATKKNRPLLNVGDVVFCEVLVIYNYNLIELTCINIDELKSFNTNETYYGPLTNGFLISLNTKHIEILYKYDCYTLKLLSNLKYQIAIGFNGRLWVNSDSSNVMKISRFIKLSYNLNQPQIKELYNHIFSTNAVKQ